MNEGAVPGGGRGDEEEAVKLSGWLVSDHRDAVLALWRTVFG